MSDATDETELIGRNELGRFEPGNRCSAGRSSRAAELKRAFADAVTESDVTEIARSLVRLAIDGDTQAAKLVLDRCCGKPDGGPTIAIQNNITTESNIDRDQHPPEPATTETLEVMRADILGRISRARDAVDSNQRSEEIDR